MGLADFLAQAGQHTAIGQVAQAFGGQTTGQKNLDTFINNDLPALVDQIHKAGSRDEITQAGQALITKGLQAGIPTGGLDKLMEMTIGPALQNMRSGEIDKFRADLQGQPASPRPQTGNELVKGPDVPAVPPRPIDQEMAVRFGQATGANPEQMTRLLSTPADIAGKELSNQKTQSALDAEKAKETAIQGLPNTPPAEGQPSAQAVARINPPGLQQFLPPRNEDYLNQMIGLKQQGLENTLAMAGQRIGAANDRASLAESRAGFNQAVELRKEFQGQSKGFQQVRDSYNRIQTSGQSPTPAGDLSMLYNYMKMLDPGSVVRESEFRSAATAKPLMERLGLSWDAVGSIWNGNKMTPGMRQDFLNRANQLYNSEAQQHQQRVNEYSRLATSQKIDPSLVITDMGAAAPPPPAVGTIYKGHRFKGGNPADKKNWEKVQGQ